MSDFELIASGAEQEPVLRLGAAPQTIGRGPTCHLVLHDESTSWQHALVWIEAGAAWVKDLGSTNGTFVNQERVYGAHRLAVGDRLGFGPEFEVQLRGPAEAIRAEGSFGVEDVAAGATHPMHTDRFVIGTDPQADLRLEEGPATASTLRVHGQEVWLGGETEDRPLSPGECFEVGGRRFRLRALDPTRAPTAAYTEERYPYRLCATLDGPTGPEARIEALDGGTSCRVRGNRAVLLFVLGRARQQDRPERSDAEAGWYCDEDLTTDVWGRTGLDFDTNNLNVLIYRTRTSLKEAGLDPWCIEKRKGYTRARVAEVKLGS